MTTFLSFGFFIVKNKLNALYKNFIQLSNKKKSGNLTGIPCWSNRRTLWSTLNLGGGFTCWSWSWWSWNLLASMWWQWWKSVIFFCNISCCFLCSWCLRRWSCASITSSFVIPCIIFLSCLRRFSLLNDTNRSLRSVSTAIGVFKKIG